MESLSSAPPYNSYVFLFSCLYFQYFQKFIFFCPIHWPHSSSSCPHWPGELHSEVFPASTCSSVVSKEKIPWTRGTWSNHSLSQIPQRESSGCCHIPGWCSGTEARWGCGTAHKQSVESRSALPSGPAAHTDCRKSKPDQGVQSWRKVKTQEKNTAEMPYVWRRTWSKASLNQWKDFHFFQWILNNMLRNYRQKFFVPCSSFCAERPASFYAVSHPALYYIFPFLVFMLLQLLKCLKIWQA